MNRPRLWLVVPALLASAVMNVVSAAEIRDKAGLFSPDAVKQAQAELDRFEKEYSVPVTLETVDSLDGVPIGQAVERRAMAVGTEGVYILIPKQDHKILAEASKHYRQFLTRTRMNSVQDAFLAQFKQESFNDGLTQGVAKLGAVLTDAKAESGGTIRQQNAPNVRRGVGAAAPGRPAPARRNAAGGFPIMGLIVGGLVLFFLFRIIGSIFRGRQANQYGGGQMMGGRGGYPGQGGPGYGGGYGGAPAGGGGFMSSLFGGIGGAMAGNWLYDKMSGHNQGGGYTDQTSYDQGTSAPIEDGGSEWSNNDAGADWGGGGGGTADQGGDWGGGGGDWGGGGGGGGDWGGGGGGSDEGGSW